MLLQRPSRYSFSDLILLHQVRLFGQGFCQNLSEWSAFSQTLTQGKKLNQFLMLIRAVGESTNLGR